MDGPRNSSINQVVDLVGLDDIDLGDRTSPDGATTIVFSDIEGSTEMMERLGEERFLAILREHNALFRRHAAAREGVVVKSQGDGFMLAFASARSAVRAAIDIQRAIRAYNEAHPDEPLSVRLGLHVGFMVRDLDDFFGRNVVLAARIADRARGGEILASRALKEYTESDPSLVFLAPQELQLKGLQGIETVHPVDWHERQ